MNRCIIALSSITYAVKAQQILNQNSIWSKVVKLESNLTKKGCSYGIEVEHAHIDNAINFMRKYGIPFSEVVR